MSRLQRVLGMVVMAMLVGVSAGVAQTAIEDALQAYGEENAKGYLQPIADLFGANMHSGYYRTAHIPTAGFNIALDFIVTGSLVGDDQKTFDAKTPQGFTPGTFKAPTIFGDPNGSSVTNQTPGNAYGTKYYASGGIFNTSMFPHFVPQLTIGSVFGTEVIGRYVFIPKIGDNMVPESNLWGLGVRHSVSQWFPGLPLDIALGYFYGSFKSGDLIDYKGSQIGVQVSKDLSPLTVYGGLATESSTMKIRYTSTDPNAGGNVEFDLDGANTFRFTGGACLRLGVFRLFAEANLGQVTSISGGFGFGF
jgi:hypothetical protein